MGEAKDILSASISRPSLAQSQPSSPTVSRRCPESQIPRTPKPKFITQVTGPAPTPCVPGRAVQMLEWPAAGRWTAGRGLLPQSRRQSHCGLEEENPDFSPAPSLQHLAGKRMSFLGGSRRRGWLPPRGVCSQGDLRNQTNLGSDTCYCSFRQAMALVPRLLKESCIVPVLAGTERREAGGPPSCRVPALLSQGGDRGAEGCAVGLGASPTGA